VYRVQRILGETQQKVLLEEVITELEVERPIEVLVDALFHGELEFVQKTRINQEPKLPSTPNPEERIIDLSDFPQRFVEIARFRLQAITPILQNESTERKKSLFEQQVKLVQIPKNNPKGYKISIRSVYRWVKDYEKSGNDIRSLIPNYGNCGGTGKSRLDNRLQNITNAVIKEYELKREKFTIDDILVLLAARINEENRFNSTDKQMILPSRATIANRIKTLDILDRLVAKNGRRKAKQMLRQSGKTEYPELPLARVEIDHTRTDLFVVDEKDGLPLGRPTLSYIIDTATRYPLGYYLGFEPPSYYAVMECLYNAILPKPNIKEIYGTEHEWIACGIPNTLVTDQGKEFVSKDLSDACESLGIALDKAPIKTPEFKATVERGFGTFNTGLFHKLPGSTFSNFIERGDYNSIDKACISLQDLEKILNLYIIDNYAEKWHSGLRGIPARRWEQALQTNFFPCYPKDSKTLRILLGRIEYRVINRYGIGFMRIQYNCPDLSYLRNKLNGEKVKFKYHPGDLSKIFVLDPFEKKYIEVPALDQEYTSNLSFWKQKIILKNTQFEIDQIDQVALGKTLQKIQNFVDETRSYKKGRTRSKYARWDRSGYPKSLSDEKRPSKRIDPATAPNNQRSSALPQNDREIIDFTRINSQEAEQGWKIVENNSQNP
jgi:putative transposase